MGKKLKVWGGLSVIDGGIQVRAIVATHTKKRAIELLNLSANEFNRYWMETGNPIELNTALSSPESVFVASSVTCMNFIKENTQQAL
ncbi:MAG: hypothetical protein QM500_17795 [Methylococcales bacterium]